MAIRKVTLDSREHGEAFASSAFWGLFPSATFENWHREWLQLVQQGVVLLGMKHEVFAADAGDMEVVQRDPLKMRQALGLPADSPGEHDISGARSSTSTS